MKKIVLMISVVLLIISLAGCTEKPNETEEKGFIPFEFIEDSELLTFYKKTTFIHKVDGFYPIAVDQDIDTTQRLNRVHQRYNEAYFEKYSLLILAFATCSSEGGINLKKILHENERFVAVFDIQSGHVNTDDIFYLYHVVQIKKKDLPILEGSSYPLDIKVNNTLYPQLGSSHYDKYISPTFNTNFNYENLTDRELDYLIYDFKDETYKKLYIINNIEYGRIVSSSTSKEDAVRVVTRHFTDERFPRHTDIVVDCKVVEETDLFYGVYVQWEYRCDSVRTYDEYVISFKKEIADIVVKNIIYDDKESYNIQTKNPTQIQTIMLYLVYNNYFFDKLVNATLTEGETLYIFTTYVIQHVYGDYGVQDKFILTKYTWGIDKLTSFVSEIGEKEMKIVYHDGVLTNIPMGR